MSHDLPTLFLSLCVGREEAAFTCDERKDSELEPSGLVLASLMMASTTPGKRQVACVEASPRVVYAPKSRPLGVYWVVTTLVRVLDFGSECSMRTCISSWMACAKSHHLDEKSQVVMAKACGNSGLRQEELSIPG